MQLDLFKVNQASPILCVDNLCLHFPGRTLFNNLSFQIFAGVSLVSGDESSGKSSLLRVLAGTLPFHGGRVQVDGADIKSLPDIYNSRVFLGDLQNGVDEQTGVLDYFVSIRQRFALFDQGRLAKMIEGLALESHITKQFYMLSTGSKRKVLLAAALASNARLVLLDDPFAGLDKQSVDFMLQQLREIATSQRQAFLLADYLPPFGVPLTSQINLDPQ